MNKSNQIERAYLMELNDSGISIAKSENYSDAKLKENQYFISKEMYDSIEHLGGEVTVIDGVVTKIDNGTPYDEIIREAQHIIHPIEQLRADVDYLAIMTGVDL